MVDSLLRLLKLLQESQPIHARHVDVGDHHVHGAVGREQIQRFDAIAGEQKLH